uniref:Amino acid transporter transmembrane domain-containing protein n=1 Tax=Zooxanthella nutricula TaxID=1333877 RepID=A0A7S2K747_9DINO
MERCESITISPGTELVRIPSVLTGSFTGATEGKISSSVCVDKDGVVSAEALAPCSPWKGVTCNRPSLRPVSSPTSHTSAALMSVSGIGLLVRRFSGESHGVQREVSIKGASMLSLAGLSWACTTRLDDEERENMSRKGMTQNEAVATFIVAAIGAGGLVLPKIMADLGVVPALAMLALCALVCLQCGDMICQACDVLESMPDGDASTYEILAEVVGGRFWKQALSVTKNVSFIGFIVLFLQFVVESIEGTAGVAADNVTAHLIVRFAVAFPLFSAIVMVTDLKQFTKFADIGILAVIVQIIAVIVGSIWRGQITDPCDPGDVDSPCRWYTWFFAPTLEGPVGAIGKNGAVILFMFAMLATVPSIRNQMEEPHRMPSVLRCGFGLTAVILAVVMSAGYYGFGGNAPDNLLNGLVLGVKGLGPTFKVLGTCGNIAVLVNVLISTPVFSVCVLSEFEATGTDSIRTPLSIPNIALRVGFALVLTCISHAMPYISEVIGIVSALFITFNNVFCPVIFLHMARRKATAARDAGLARDVPRKRVFALHAGLLVIGGLVMVFGFLGALDALLSKMSGAAGPVIS